MGSQLTRLRKETALRFKYLELLTWITKRGREKRKDEANIYSAHRVWVTSGIGLPTRGCRSGGE